MKKKEDLKRVTLRIQPTLHKMVVQIAEENERPINQMYCMLIHEAIMKRDFNKLKIIK